ncbi:hypothetical protein FD754_008013 [Muntiacus muntjak]|uniref:Protein tweety homolog n=1 Tax=Muntiacus muntjak TaxID=9888 RepID=A0A5N3WSH8_MUNMU|nr:hypothetical protein FD754_008013 [Muntiacus muntjak]
MPAARVEYIAPWWVVWLHSVPHLGLRLQPVDSTFRPRDESYQESLLLLGLVAAVGLGLNLVLLAAYLVCACCCRQDDAAQTKRPRSCCITWTAVVAALLCCAAVGAGFYGNSEANDGVYQLLYALDNANHTFSGIDVLVSGTTQKMQVDLEQHLARLGEIFAARGDYLQTLKFLHQTAGSIIVQMAGVPPWTEVTEELTDLANQTSYVEYYRWLAYLLLFILDLVLCLLACLGLAKRSRCLLASMLSCGVLALLLSWTSLAADAAVAVVMFVTEGQIYGDFREPLSLPHGGWILYCLSHRESPGHGQTLSIGLLFSRSVVSDSLRPHGLPAARQASLWRCLAALGFLGSSAGGSCSACTATHHPGCWCPCRALPRPPQPSGQPIQSLSCKWTPGSHCQERGGPGPFLPPQPPHAIAQLHELAPSRMSSADLSLPAEHAKPGHFASEAAGSLRFPAVLASD